MDDTSTTAAMSVMSPMLVARPSSAVPMGRPIAITDPNASSSTITAASRPMSSWPTGAVLAASEGRSPPSSICTAPLALAASAVASKRWNASSPISLDGWLYCTSA